LDPPGRPVRSNKIWRRTRYPTSVSDCWNGQSTSPPQPNQLCL
jgi:hypothetical protein